LDTSNIKITLLSVAYRDKKIVETIEDAFNKCNDPKDIRLSITIQDSYRHKIKEFSKSDKIEYFLWDHFEGFVKHRARMINLVPDDHYILFISSSTKFKQGWDTNLKDFIKNNNKKTLISLYKDKFSLRGTLINKEIIKDVGHPSYLRLTGEEEDLSIRLYAKSYDILDGIDKFIEVEEEKEYDYIPFSKTHNYNEVYSLYNYGFNKFVDLRKNIDRVNFYSKKYPIKKIYHQLNDVEYTYKELPHRGMERFINHGSRI
jgi:hypothetical protein